MNTSLVLAIAATAWRNPGSDLKSVRRQCDVIQLGFNLRAKAPSPLWVLPRIFVKTHRVTVNCVVAQPERGHELSTASTSASQLQLSVLECSEELAHDGAVGDGSGHAIDGRIPALGQLWPLHYLRNACF